MATKVDFKRELHQLYGASREPHLVDVPVLSYLMIDGHGDPNTAVEYRQAVEALYALSYAAKFLVKGAPDGVDYGVLPLEGCGGRRTCPGSRRRTSRPGTGP